MRIKGMTCARCEKTVAEALTGGGARRVVVHWRKGTAAFDAAGVPSDQLQTAVEEAGYRVVDIDTAT
ncbi:MAG: heavy-metal-associated domain-containing protein [Candidatus Dormibacteria bacterium]